MKCTWREPNSFSLIVNHNKRIESTFTQSFFITLLSSAFVARLLMIHFSAVTLLISYVFPARSNSPLYIVCTFIFTFIIGPSCLLTFYDTFYHKRYRMRNE